jgi:molybdenum cofactor cytidylyltransferase
VHEWSALILAAGAGRRFGGGKLLAEIVGVPVIRRTAEAVTAAGFADIVITCGADYRQIELALAGLPCRIMHVTGWQEGMAASLRAGIAALQPATKGVFVFLGDMPLVPVRLCEELAGMAEAAGYAVRPLVAGKPGHPAAFTRQAFSDVSALSGDVGANGLLAGRPGGVAYLVTTDAGALIDIDSPADLAVAEREWNSRATSATSESAISRGDLPKP